MVKHALLAVLLCALCIVKADAQPLSPARKGTPAPAISAEKYRETLIHAEAALHALESNGPRTAAKVRTILPPAVAVKRSDGEIQAAENSDLRNHVNTSSPGSAPRKLLSKKDVRQLAEDVTAQRRALEQWMQPRDGNFYQPADARRIITQLENTGQIRTGPTRYQQWSADVRKWFGDLLQKIANWIFGSSPKSPLKAPHIDERWLKFFFYSAVLSLLLLIGYLLWKSLGGRWMRRGAERHVRYLEGEDAELLRLPPDELRDRAARFAAEGNFREALRHLYISLLVNLDARGVWRYDTRRTNWEHIHALRADPSLSVLVAPISDLTRRFDRVRYGNALASRTDWLRFEKDVQSVENLPQAQTRAVDSARAEGARK